MILFTSATVSTAAKNAWSGDYAFYRGSSVSILINTPSGFVDETSARSDFKHEPAVNYSHYDTIEYRDFNSDGFKDILLYRSVGNSDGEFATRILLNDGTGKFAEASYPRGLSDGLIIVIDEVTSKYALPTSSPTGQRSANGLGNYSQTVDGLIFDWSKGLRFISYAVWWVRQSILQSLNENARTIRLPVNVVQELHRAKKELDSAGVALPEKFATLPYTINLDNPLNEEGDTLLDIIVNPNAELADANLSTEDTLKKKLIEMLDVLDNRERVIIEDYFGLSGNTRTLEDIGGDFSLTKERVRQIKEKALRKLRNETSSLFDYM